MWPTLSPLTHPGVEGGGARLAAQSLETTHLTHCLAPHWVLPSLLSLDSQPWPPLDSPIEPQIPQSLQFSPLQLGRAMRQPLECHCDRWPTNQALSTWSTSCGMQSNRPILSMWGTYTSRHARAREHTRTHGAGPTHTGAIQRANMCIWVCACACVCMCMCGGTAGRGSLLSQGEATAFLSLLSLT